MREKENRSCLEVPTNELTTNEQLIQKKGYSSCLQIFSVVVACCIVDRTS
jgi:hypothetical protein